MSSRSRSCRPAPFIISNDPSRNFTTCDGQTHARSDQLDISSIALATTRPLWGPEQDQEETAPVSRRT
eukprot:3179330-Rhodomonas_salina.1